MKNDSLLFCDWICQQKRFPQSLNKLPTASI